MKPATSLHLMKSLLVFSVLFFSCGLLSAQPALPLGTVVSWDRHSLLFDGRRVCPVMGEIHYSRVPAQEWPAEVRKMREGGVTIIATYVFWNHIEEQENQFDWSGQRDLRRFLEVCKAEGMPVVLRIGPWCHGEVRNGGLPDWLFQKQCRMRSEDSTFLAYTTRLYRQIFTQVQGLQWKDGGPVLAAQFDNEYRGPASYLLALKRIALSIGFDLPFYTRTGWPELTTPMPFGEMLPLFGDYADGFWDKSTQEGVGSYYKAFNFKGQRVSTSIGTDFLTYSSDSVSDAKRKTSSTYPYFTCELGGGMATAYHRRPFVYPEDAYSMALVKLGSGSNLLGYYMYHGGTNPEGRLNTLNECQTSPFTANNDLPVCTYDFQAPLGEFGQTYPQYYRLRPLHLFMQDFGELLAPMEANFPAAQDLKQGDDSALRWSVRADGKSAFVFFNNYERFANLTAKRAVQFEACGVRFPQKPITIPAGSAAIFPVNVAGLRYATAQLVSCRDGKICLMQVPGIPTTIVLQNGRTLNNVKPLGLARPVCDNIYLLSRDEAEHLYLPQRAELKRTDVPFLRILTAGTPRSIQKGRAKVAAAPTEEDWQQAAVYRIKIGKGSNAAQLSRENPAPSLAGKQDAAPSLPLLSITYRGDCARLYAIIPASANPSAITSSSVGSSARRLVADNFYYGRPFLYGLWRLPAGCEELELRILPLQPDAPIYLPREADRTPGETLSSISLIPCK